MIYILTQDREAIVPILGDEQNFIFFEENINSEYDVYYGSPANAYTYLGTYRTKNIANEVIVELFDYISKGNRTYVMPSILYKTKDTN
jgi:hypothetical protein